MDDARGPREQASEQVRRQPICDQGRHEGARVHVPRDRVPQGRPMGGWRHLAWPTTERKDDRRHPRHAGEALVASRARRRHADAAAVLVRSVDARDRGPTDARDHAARGVFGRLRRVRAARALPRALAFGRDQTRRPEPTRVRLHQVPRAGPARQQADPVPARGHRRLADRAVDRGRVAGTHDGPVGVQAARGAPDVHDVAGPAVRAVARRARQGIGSCCTTRRPSTTTRRPSTTTRRPSTCSHTRDISRNTPQSRRQARSITRSHSRGSSTRSYTTRCSKTRT